MGHSWIVLAELMPFSCKPPQQAVGAFLFSQCSFSSCKLTTFHRALSSPWSSDTICTHLGTQRGPWGTWGTAGGTLLTAPSWAQQQTEEVPIQVAAKPLDVTLCRKVTAPESFQKSSPRVI